MYKINGVTFSQILVVVHVGRGEVLTGATFLFSHSILVVSLFISLIVSLLQGIHQLLIIALLTNCIKYILM